MTSGLAHVETCISCVLRAPLGLSWQAARQWGTAPWLGRTGEPLRVAQTAGSSATEVGGTRVFLVGNSQMFEQLTALDDQEHTLRWKLISHPQTVSPFLDASFVNYASTIHLRSITVGDTTFAEWKGQFYTEPHNVQQMQTTLESWYLAGLQSLQDFVASGTARSAPLPTSLAGASVAGVPSFPQASAVPSFPPASVVPSFPHTSAAPLPAVGAQAFGTQPGCSSVSSVASASVPQRDFDTAAKRFAEVLQQAGGSSGGMQHRMSTSQEPWQPAKGKFQSAAQGLADARAAFHIHPDQWFQRHAMHAASRTNEYCLEQDRVLHPQGPGPPIGASHAAPSVSTKMSLGSTKMSLGSQTEGSSHTGDNSRCSSWGTDKGQQQRPISDGNGAAMADTVAMDGRSSSKGGKNSSGSCSGSGSGSDSQQMEGSHVTAPELDSGTRSTSLGSDEQPLKEQAVPQEEDASSDRFLQSFGSFARHSFLHAHASAASMASKQAAAEASFMDNLAERLEAHNEAQVKRRSSFEEDALRLEERHRQLHKARTRNASASQAQSPFASPFGAPIASPFAAQPDSGESS